MSNHQISVTKASVHNLKGINAVIPHGVLCCLTGVSGSGKSSFAFDTLCVEGQRRYVLSLSHQAKRIIGNLPKPDVESISGLTPTIAIEQKTSGGSPRSTVATMTEIHDYLRVLYARLAIPHCPESGKPLVAISRKQIIEELFSCYAGKALILLAPIAKKKRGTLHDEVQKLAQKGFSRVRLDDLITPIDEIGDVDPAASHDLDVVVDRVKVCEENRQRLIESSHTALEVGKGLISVIDTDGEEKLFSEYAYSDVSGRSYPPLEPNNFSYNSPAGMCPECQGLGECHERRGARAKGKRGSHGPLSACPKCHGSRLQAYASAARFRGMRLQELVSKTIDEALAWIQAIVLTPQEAFAKETISQIQSRLSFLQRVGLGYVTLDRKATTLSGGEFQRLRLASHMGGSLVGITYVLDEPSIGLHPHDNEKLIASLIELKHRGNTVIVVEHDAQMMRASDWILDFGRGAGMYGGELLHQGSVSSLEQVAGSLTSDYLFGRKSIAPNEKKKAATKKKLCLRGVRHRNIDNLDVELPLERCIAITGVSGSGKSSLIFEVLYPALANRLMHSNVEKGRFASLTGAHHLDRVIHIDQTPIGRTPRSNPVTYSGIFDDIRTLFASLPASKAMGYTPDHFSMNQGLKARKCPTGRGCRPLPNIVMDRTSGICPVCAGMGVIAVDMDSLERTWTTCSSCEGRRFNENTLSIRYKGKSILDVLNMTCQEARDFFAPFPRISAILEILCQVGLDYLHLGQPATTLSGGEAQRLKIARELGKPATGKTLYLLDEPTTGLHMHDIRRLVDVLHALVGRGDTVVVIEHNMDLVKTADFLIDMGPGAGRDGGKIIAAGHPSEVAQLDTPTGRALRLALAPQPHSPTPPPRQNRTQGCIEIVGACQNTLKNLSLSLPKEQLIAIIGPSGAGKSSLAVETLFAEGQRQYIESLSPYARHFIKQMPRPSVDAIYGLPPAIAITQREQASNPRSTVGTLTEIYEYLRIFWAQRGIPHCPKTKAPIRPVTKEYVADVILREGSASPVYIVAPCQRASAATAPQQIAAFQKIGYSRFRINNRIVDTSQEELPPFRAGRKVSIEVIIDRLRPIAEEKQRLVASIAEAARIGGNRLVVLQEDRERLFNLAFSVAETGESYPEITAQTFAFNTSHGMCPQCHGRGVEATTQPCSACQGTRLHALARHVTICGASIADICHMPMSQARQFLKDAVARSPLEKPLQRVFDALDYRLGLVDELGIGYLSLDRCASSLSSGEAQRIRLISQIGSQLSELLYILEEPTAGLHPQDTERLIAVLHRLKALGNTIAVIEHDPQLIHRADHILELGPRGGRHGGRIVAEGSPPPHLSSPTMSAFAEPFILNDGSSLAISAPSIIVRSATCHTLENVACTLPTQAVIGIVGVSGSGKSTLLFNVLQPALMDELAGKPSAFVSGLDEFDQYVVIDQKPIAHTSRSDLSTFMGLAPHLRALFAALPSARAQGLDATRFSAYHRRGMCTRCHGLGDMRVDMHFLPSVRVPCEACGGLRLNPSSLSVLYKGKNFGQILQLPIEEARTLFAGHPKITRYLDGLMAMGLGDLRLGAETASLSTGEAQRAKLARELAQRRTAATLYLMDEPTIGLHINEVRGLISQLHSRKEEGHTVIVVEHNIDLIAACDWLVELGPGAGPNGGKVIASGTPMHIARQARTPTGKYLRERPR